MMKNIAFLVALTLLASCSPQNGPIVDTRIISISEGLPTTGLMGKTLVANAEINSAISAADQVVVVVPSDKALSGMNLTADFLKRHVVLQAISADGTYTSMNGDTWTVTGGMPSPLNINGVKVNGCIQTYTKSLQSGKFSYVCMTDKALTD